jgi:large subunit ribosomal protein L4
MDKQIEKKETIKQETSLLSTWTYSDLGVEWEQVDASVDYALWVRVLMQNWRQGTVGCKARGDLTRSNKKPWKQKGTGRARAGSARSPLWRGGGVIFGPQMRTRTLKINKKNKSRVSRQVMLELVKAGRLGVLDWSIDGDKPKTRQFVAALKQSNIDQKTITLFVDRTDFLVGLSVRNMMNVQTVFFDDINAYSLTANEQVIVLKKDVNLFKEMVARWS